MARLLMTYRRLSNKSPIIKNINHFLSEIMPVEIKEEVIRKSIEKF